MKSSKRIVFEISKESSLDKAAEMLEVYFREMIIKDRMAILEDLATQMWYTEKDSEDYDLAYGYDDNGYPNSVNLIIYGRTHSDYRIPDFKNQQ